MEAAWINNHATIAVRDRDPVNLAPFQLGKKRSRIHDNGGKVTATRSYAQTGIRIAMPRVL